MQTCHYHILQQNECLMWLFSPHWDTVQSELMTINQNAIVVWKTCLNFRAKRNPFNKIWILTMIDLHFNKKNPFSSSSYFTELALIILDWHLQELFKDLFRLIPIFVQNIDFQTSTLSWQYLIKGVQRLWNSVNYRIGFPLSRIINLNFNELSGKLKVSKLILGGAHSSLKSEKKNQTPEKPTEINKYNKPIRFNSINTKNFPLILWKFEFQIKWIS